MIGSATFDSLTELVQYYESNPLYRRMKLKYAINDEVLKSIGEVRGGVAGGIRDLAEIFHQFEELITEFAKKNFLVNFQIVLYSMHKLPIMEA